MWDRQMDGHETNALWLSAADGDNGSKSDPSVVQ